MVRLIIHASDFQRLFKELGGALPCFVIEISLADLEVRSRGIIAACQTLAHHLLRTGVLALRD